MPYWIVENLRRFKSSFAKDVLAALDERAACETLGGFVLRVRHWDGWALLRTFLCQVAGGEPCREAVERAIQRQWVPDDASINTGAYCQARQRLPEAPLKALALSVGRALHEQTSSSDSFAGRPVKVADGTGLRLPDTPANQMPYPQPSGQKPGCGFPLMYVCALMGLASGAVLDVAVGGGAGGERGLLRRLWQALSTGDILLSDAGLGSYAEIACLRERGVDVVVRLPRRRGDGAVVKSFGPGDRLVEWKRPGRPAPWTRAEDLPAALVVRIVEFTVECPGFRTREVRLATTLVDPAVYPADGLAGLYRRRWEMELRLRDIKETMGLGELRCKSPKGCRKELWMGLLAYNLIRTVMADAARSAGLPVARISLAGAIQRIRQFASGRLLERAPRRAYAMLLEHLAQDALPARPGRREPRAVKRRPKNYQLLTAPRHECHEYLHRNRYRKA